MRRQLNILITWCLLEFSGSSDLKSLFSCVLAAFISLYLTPSHVFCSPCLPYIWHQVVSSLSGSHPHPHSPSAAGNMSNSSMAFRQSIEHWAPSVKSSKQKSFTVKKAFEQGRVFWQSCRAFRQLFPGGIIGLVDGISLVVGAFDGEVSSWASVDVNKSSVCNMKYKAGQITNFSRSISHSSGVYIELSSEHSQLKNTLPSSPPLFSRNCSIATLQLSEQSCVKFRLKSWHCWCISIFDEKKGLYNGHTSGFRYLITFFSCDDTQSH